MNTVLWSFQILLALAFLYSGCSKAFFTKEKMLSMGQTGVVGLPVSVIHMIGVLELFGVAGIILPWKFNIMPVLTPVAAVCFAVIMLLAARIHYALREPKNVASNIFLLCICLVVAYFRFTEVR